MLIQGQSGYLVYGGRGLDEINDRMYNSPLLKANRSFGAAIVSGGGVTFFDKFSDTSYGISAFSLSESASAKARGMSLNASLHLMGIGFSIGKRVSPFAKPAFSFTRAATGKKNPRLMTSGFARTEILYLSHQYARRVDSSFTRVEYDVKAFHATFGCGFRSYFVLAPSLLVFGEASASTSQILGAQTTLRTFTVSQQDLRYRGHELQLKDMGSSTINTLRIEMGVSFSL